MQSACSALDVNATHVTCSCNAIARIRVDDGDHAPQPPPNQQDASGGDGDGIAFAALVAAISIILISVTVLAVVFVVLYCRRIKVRTHAYALMIRRFHFLTFCRFVMQNIYTRAAGAERRPRRRQSLRTRPPSTLTRSAAQRRSQTRRGNYAAQ